MLIPYQDKYSDTLPNLIEHFAILRQPRKQCSHIYVYTLSVR